MNFVIPQTVDAPVCSASSIERKVTITAENACFHGDSSNDQDLAICHGDQNEKETSGLMINVYSPSTSSGKWIPPPWTESRTISPSHIALAGDLKVHFESKSAILKIDGTSDIAVSTTPTDEFVDNHNARYRRLQQVNEETHNLHLKTVQRGSGSMDFAKLLEGINPNSDEVVKHELSCKCILNLNTFGDSTFDIMGDCKLIMTEYSHGTKKQRIIYLFQVCRIFQYFYSKLQRCASLIFLLDRQDSSSWT